LFYLTTEKLKKDWLVFAVVLSPFHLVLFCSELQMHVAKLEQLSSFVYK